MTTHHYATPDGTQYRVIIERDDDAVSPRDADNVTMMVLGKASNMQSPDHGYVKDSELPDIPIHEYSDRRYSGSVDMRRIRKYAALFLPDVIAIAGIDIRHDWTPTLALTDDDSADGYIVITRKAWDTCMGADTEPAPEYCRDIMRDEIDACNRWLSGEYVGFIVEERTEWTRADGLTRWEWETVESLYSIDDPDYALTAAVACLPDDAESIDMELEHDPADIDSLDCARVGSHHSDDRVTVFTGKPAPYLMCGFHASQIDASFLARIAEGK